MPTPEKNFIQLIRCTWLLIILITGYACKPTVPSSSAPARYTPRKTVVLDGFKHPWGMCFLDEENLLLTEKDGHLLRVNIPQRSKTIIQGFPEDLADSIRVKDRRDNSGIFEVLLHPDFDTNQLIYLSYAAQNEQGTTTKIVQAHLEGDSLDTVKTLLVATPYSSDLFHYGGGMTFGLDGKLYVTIGERLFNEIDQPPLPIAQDPTDKRGKIYRLNEDGSIPSDNPDFGEAAVPGLFAMGIRAAQGITVNPFDGSIWFSEHGSVHGDELNRLQAGANYGWPIKTSGAYRNAAYIPPNAGETVFTGPRHTWIQTIAPTGLTFYSGSAFPSWEGDLILAGLSMGSLWRLRIEEEVVISAEELFLHERVRSRKVALSPSGKLYLLTDEPHGKLIEITP